jgi:hypothetical protein
MRSSETQVAELHGNTTVHNNKMHDEFSGFRQKTKINLLMPGKAAAARHNKWR